VADAVLYSVVPLVVIFTCNATTIAKLRQARLRRLRQLSAVGLDETAPGVSATKVKTKTTNSRSPELVHWRAGGARDGKVTADAEVTAPLGGSSSGSGSRIRELANVSVCGSGVSGGSHVRSPMNRRASVQQVTVLLLSISTFYLVASLPVALLKILTTIAGVIDTNAVNSDYRMYSQYRLAETITYLCMYSNHALTVRVTDVNDNPPEIEGFERGYQFAVWEETSSNVSVGGIHIKCHGCRSRDPPKNRDIQFRIMSISPAEARSTGMSAETRRSTFESGAENWRAAHCDANRRGRRTADFSSAWPQKTRHLLQLRAASRRRHPAVEVRNVNDHAPKLCRRLRDRTSHCVDPDEPVVTTFDTDSTVPVFSRQASDSCGAGAASRSTIACSIRDESGETDCPECQRPASATSPRRPRLACRAAGHPVPEAEFSLDAGQSRMFCIKRLPASGRMRQRFSFRLRLVDANDDRLSAVYRGRGGRRSRADPDEVGVSQRPRGGRRTERARGGRWQPCRLERRLGSGGSGRRARRASNGRSRIISSSLTMPQRGGGDRRQFVVAVTLITRCWCFAAVIAFATVLFFYKLASLKLASNCGINVALLAVVQPPAAGTSALRPPPPVDETAGVGAQLAHKRVPLVIQRVEPPLTVTSDQRLCLVGSARRSRSVPNKPIQGVSAVRQSAYQSVLLLTLDGREVSPALRGGIYPLELLLECVEGVESRQVEWRGPQLRFCCSCRSDVAVRVTFHCGAAIAESERGRRVLKGAEEARGGRAGRCGCSCRFSRRSRSDRQEGRKFPAFQESLLGAFLLFCVEFGACLIAYPGQNWRWLELQEQSCKLLAPQQQQQQLQMSPLSATIRRFDGFS
uniref:Cadherin domain-containing protein n=1 Tax=Macrostomum lignano TaxID=282301 RepID=A0A1I8HYV4_9PLAT